MSRHSQPSVPEPLLPIPARDPTERGVDLSILGYNELLGPEDSSDRLAVTGLFLDLAMRRHLTLEEIRTVDGDTDFRLHEHTPPPPDRFLDEPKPLLDDEKKVLGWLFSHIRSSAPSRTVTLSELERNGLANFVDKTQGEVRKAMASGNDQKRYFVKSPREQQAAKRWLNPLRMGMAVLGFAGGNGDIIGRLFDASDASERVTQFAEARGMRMRGEMGRLQLETLMTALMETLTFIDWNPQRLSLVRRYPRVLQRHEQALPFLKILASGNGVMPDPWYIWARQLSLVYNKQPDWFIPLRESGDASASLSEKLPIEEALLYDAHAFGRSLTEFIYFSDFLLGGKKRSSAGERIDQRIRNEEYVDGAIAFSQSS